MASVHHYGKKNYRKIIDTLLSILFNALQENYPSQSDAMAGTALFWFSIFSSGCTAGADQYDLLIKERAMLSIQKTILIQ